MTANVAESEPVRLALVQLEALAADLAERGYETHVAHDGGTLSLRVVNQEAPSSHENIAASATDDGTWWFWWSWGDRIALVTDVEAAAFKIAYVLTPQADG
jgi:hypothetical protein